LAIAELGADAAVVRYGWTGLMSQAGWRSDWRPLVAYRLSGVGLAMQAVTVG
jgi:hypothetical protein